MVRRSHRGVSIRHGPGAQPPLHATGCARAYSLPRLPRLDNRQVARPTDTCRMWIVAIAWMYVVLMMCVVEALSPRGTLLGAFFTFVLYGALPLSVLLYLMGTPLRRKAARRAQLEAPEAGPAPATAPRSGPGIDGRDGGGHAPTAAVAPEREEAGRVGHRAP